MPTKDQLIETVTMAVRDASRQLLAAPASPDVDVRRCPHDPDTLHVSMTIAPVAPVVYATLPESVLVDDYLGPYTRVESEISAYLHDNPSGGSLHIALADGNVADGHLEMCAAFAADNGDADGVRLATMLLDVSEEVRHNMASNGWRYRPTNLDVMRDAIDDAGDA